MKRNTGRIFILLAVLFPGINSYAQNYSIVRSARFAYVVDSSGKKLDSLRIPKMTPDIKFAIDSTIIVSIHSTADTISHSDKGFMLIFYSLVNNKLKQLHSYPVTITDAEEMRKMDIKAGQGSILLNNGNIFNNTYRIPIRSCIRKPDLIKLIKLVGTK